jgi:hypothetical protein
MQLLILVVVMIPKDSQTWRVVNHESNLGEMVECS